MPPRNVTEQGDSMRILLIFLVWITTAHAEIVKVEKRGVADDRIKCEWNNSEGVPCVTISKRPNSNIISNKINPTQIITPSDIEKYNLTDLTKVLKFVNNVNVVQSGPTGQQSSVFMRGSNSNHTLVLLNGIPINDQSTTNGAYDFGQDFMSSVLGGEVYKGSAGAHFGADAIGGAVNIVTDIDYEKKISISGADGNRNIKVNYAKYFGDWQIGIKSGYSEAKTQSALAGGTDKDGAENLSMALTIKRWFTEKLQFRTHFFTRNTYALLDGHSLALQEGYDADNNLYALQTGFDYDTRFSKNYITFHSHSYGRDYNSPGNELDEYNSDAYAVRAEHKNKLTERLSYGLGFEYKIDEATFNNRGSYQSSVSSDYTNTGFFSNVSYALVPDLAFSLHYRTDDNDVIGTNESYKLGLIKENLLPNLNVTLSHSTGFKNPSLYELAGADNYGYQGNINLDSEQSKTNEVGFEFNGFTLNLFETEIANPISYSYPTYINGSGLLKQSGIELGYSYSDNLNSFKIFGSSLSSKKTNGDDQLRRPEWSTGFNFARTLDKGLNLVTNYNFVGEHFDIHNSNYSTIRMPEVHLLDVGITKDWYGIEYGVKISNLLGEDYQAPHGFSQDGSRLNFVLKSKF